MSFVPLPCALISRVWRADGLTGRWWHGWAGSRDFTVLWGDSPSWRAFPGEGLRFPWNWSAPRAELPGPAPEVPVSLLLWFSHPAPARGSFPAHPSRGGVWAAPPVRSAGSTRGMPLIAVLIGFLLVPSIFSKQKAGGSRCYLLFHNKCSCGDQRSRNCGGFFPFSLFSENCSKTSSPLEKALNSAGMFKGCLCYLEDLICESIPGFICSSYLKGILFFPKNPGPHLAHAVILHSKEKHKISIEGLKFGSLKRDREEEAKHGDTGRQVRASVHWRELGNRHFLTTKLWKNAKCGCGVICIETM